MSNEELIKNLEKYDIEVNKLFQENKQLKKNIDKAIAYIEENTTDPEFVVSGELQENQVIELLKILKGEENEK